MALAEPKDLSLSPKSNSSSSARVSVYLFSFPPFSPIPISMHFFLFSYDPRLSVISSAFLAGPCYVCLTPPKLLPPFFSFFFHFGKTIVRETAAFSNEKKEKSILSSPATKRKQPWE